MLAKLRGDRCFYAEARAQEQQLYLPSPALPALVRRTHEELLSVQLTALMGVRPTALRSTSPVPLRFGKRSLDDVLESAAPRADVLFTAPVKGGQRADEEDKEKWCCGGAEEAETEDSEEDMDGGVDDEDDDDEQPLVMHRVLSRTPDGPELLAALPLPLMRSMREVFCLENGGFLATKLVPRDTSASDRRHRMAIDAARQCFLPDCARLSRSNSHDCAIRPDVAMPPRDSLLLVPCALAVRRSRTSRTAHSQTCSSARH